MSRHALILVCLAACTAGPLVATAEAAEAFAASLAELTVPDVIEPGAGGDDGPALDALPQNPVPAPPAVAPAFDSWLPPAQGSVVAAPPRSRWAGECSWPPNPRRARYACLQVFRF